MGYIYLIKSGDDGYKIGFTKKDAFQRLNELSTGNPNELELIHVLKTDFDFKMERTLHRFYKIKNIKNEWFDLTEEDVNNFPNIFYEIEKNFLTLKLFGNNE